MRATPPTNALSNEADIAKVQEWLSHASISTTPSRLPVKIAVDPAVAMQQIPSLMLQPIVENALKHGLGPKPGPGHLWITAEADGNQVRLRVEAGGWNARHNSVATRERSR
jgi:two-component system LytT family sensor kinase